MVPKDIREEAEKYAKVSSSPQTSVANIVHSALSMMHYLFQTHEQLSIGNQLVLKQHTTVLLSSSLDLDELTPTSVILVRVLKPSGVSCCNSL